MSQPRYVELDWAVVLECGCLFGTSKDRSSPVAREGNAFVMRPCQTECPNFKKAMAMSAEAQKPMDLRWWAS